MKSRISFFVAILLAFVFSAPALADVDYVVKRGDSMYGVAKRFGIPGQMVVRANRNFKNPHLIHPGEKLVIPGVVETEPIQVREPSRNSPPAAPVLPPNMREAEKTISELGAQIAKADEVNAVLNRRLKELQKGQSELTAETANLGLQNQLVREENARLLAENEALRREVATLRGKIPPLISQNSSPPLSAGSSRAGGLPPSFLKTVEIYTLVLFLFLIGVVVAWKKGYFGNFSTRRRLSDGTWEDPSPKIEARSAQANRTPAGSKEVDPSRWQRVGSRINFKIPEDQFTLAGGSGNVLLKVVRETEEGDVLVALPLCGHECAKGISFKQVRAHLVKCSELQRAWGVELKSKASIEDEGIPVSYTHH